MELYDLALPRNAAADALEFALQNAEVRRSDLFVFLNDDVARAEQAEALAKGNMRVQRNRRPSAIRFLMHFFQVVRSEGIIPDRRGRIAGVTRTGPIVSGEKLFAHTEFLTHLLQGWIGERHGIENLNATARQAWPLPVPPAARFQ